MKKAGILNHISSLPSTTGVGDFGENAYRFVDMLYDNGLMIWQILPLNPVGYGSSPYQPYSSFAGEDLYIALDKLVKMGLLNEYESFQESSTKVDFEAVRKHKETYYKEAFKNFKDNYENYRDEYEVFVNENDWLEGYAIFFTFKTLNDLQSWSNWPEEMKFYPENKQVDISAYSEEIDYIKFKQFLFLKQWLELKSYANEKQIEIIGDVPIYVAEDSQDVWENKEVFQFNDDYSLKFVAGCPPDGFSEDGQLWGNPIYNWEYLKETDFKFLVNRFKTCGTMYDVTRIDHFLGFDRYWRIPGGDITARNGQWVEAYGDEFFAKLFEAFPSINLIAEDLGSIRQETHDLRNKYQMPGMKIYMHCVDDVFTCNVKGSKMVAYTGSHDCETTKAFLDEQPQERIEAFRNNFKEYDNNKSLVENFVYLTLLDDAERVVIPTQDILELGIDARFNLPSTIGEHNWTWKLSDYSNLEKKLLEFGKDVKKANR